MRIGSSIRGAYGALLLGLNVAAAPAGADVTVAALGDSLTAGYGLPAEAGFVPQLEAWLRARGAEVTLVNAGVSGDTTAGGLARADWTLEGGADALIVALGGNDVLRGLPPEAARANLDGILAKAATKGLPVLLVGISAPPNYGAAYQQGFAALYADLARARDALLYPDFLAALGTDRAAALACCVQADGLHPNAEGVRRIVEDMGPRVLDLIARAASPD